MIANKWIELATRAIFITANLYSPIDEKYINILVMTEITPAGSVHGSKIKSTVFRANIYNTEVGKGAISWEVVRLFISVYLIFNLIRILRDKPDEAHRTNYRFVYTIKGLTDITIALCSIASFCISYNIMLEDDDIFYSDGYKDLYDVSQLYISYLALNSWIAFTTIFRFILFFGLNDKVYIYLLTLEWSSRNTFWIIILITLFLIGFCLMALHIWGPFLSDYRDLDWATMGNMMFAVGEADIEVLIKVDLSWTMMFFFAYFFIIVFFLISSFLGIMYDSYTRVKLRRDAVSLMIKEGSYKPKTVTYWLTYSIPGFLKKLSCKKKKPVREDDDMYSDISRTNRESPKPYERAKGR